jgi:hypothetical protein
MNKILIENKKLEKTLSEKKNILNRMALKFQSEEKTTKQQNVEKHSEYESKEAKLLEQIYQARIKLANKKNQPSKPVKIEPPRQVTSQKPATKFTVVSQSKLPINPSRRFNSTNSPSPQLTRKQNQNKNSKLYSTFLTKRLFNLILIDI